MTSQGEEEHLLVAIPYLHELLKKRDAGSQYRCGWVGRGVQPPSTPMMLAPPHTHTQPVAQGQYVVSDTRCPALYDCEME